MGSLRWQRNGAHHYGVSSSSMAGRVPADQPLPPLPRGAVNRWLTPRLRRSITQSPLGAQRTMKPRELLGWLIAAGLLVAVVFAYLPRDAAIAGAVRVVDGDSLYVGGVEVRLFGVDAFEGWQVCVRDADTWPCGEAASDALRELTEGHAVTCSQRDTDIYRRAVSVCTNGTVDLSAELARAGLALAYREYSDDYVDEEDEARTARRGAWTGEFTAPWDERNGQGTQPTQPSNQSGGTSNCRNTGIKGNINNGRKLYHVPGSNNYEETVIDESKGERWFCTEEEAVREGWSRAHG